MDRGNWKELLMTSGLRREFSFIDVKWSAGTSMTCSESLNSIIPKTNMRTILLLLLLFRVCHNHPLPLPACFHSAKWVSPFCLCSEDAHPLSEALHICILPAIIIIIWGQRGGRTHEVSGVRQGMFFGKCLPAAVVTLVGDVTLAQFCLQLPQVQPCLIILRDGRRQRDEITVSGASDPI